METTEPLTNILARLRSKFPPMLPNTKPLNSGRSCRGTYDWLPREELERHMTDIVEIEEKQKLCRECDGTCKQDTEGFFPVVSETATGYFSYTLQMCRKEEAKREQRRLERIIQSSCIPNLYSGKTLEDYIVTDANRKAVSMAKWLIRHQSMGALFYGATGTGKTLLAAIVANEKMKQGITVAFASVPDLLMDIRDSFGTGRTGEILRSIQKAPCLVLDDFGAERMSEWVGEQVFSIVNYRSNHELQTIITTNYGLKELDERMRLTGRNGAICGDVQSHRILSRICGMCYIVELGGRDYRMEGV